MTRFGTGQRYRFDMIYAITLLGIYILSVLVIYFIARFRPHVLWRLHSVLFVALFSFVPAIALGREMLLRTELRELVSMAPTWLSTGFAVLFVVGIIPLQRWIRTDVLDRTAGAARNSLDKLPEQMMTIEAAECRREISMEEATERKAQVQRGADRMAAIDGVGRVLYWLLKLHLVRLGIQFVGSVTTAIWLTTYSLQEATTTNLSLVAADAFMIIAPCLLLSCGVLCILKGSDSAFSQSAR